MRKIFVVDIFVGLLVFSQTIFAQSNEMLNNVLIDQKYSFKLEEFLNKISQKDYSAAYIMTGDDFKEKSSLDDFALLANATGLSNFTQKKWTKFEKKALGLLVVLQSEFTTPDQIIHYVQFELVNGPHEIKIKSITETISLQALKLRFPPKFDLPDLVKKDLHALIPLIAEDEAAAIYNYLSNAAKNRIKLTDIYRLLLNFRRQKLDLTFPDTAPVIIFYRSSPKLTKEGLMEVSGTFQNQNYTVNFTLSYDYEWRWKLGGFSFTAKRH